MTRAAFLAVLLVFSACSVDSDPPGAVPRTSGGPATSTVAPTARVSPATIPATPPPKTKPVTAPTPGAAYPERGPVGAMATTFLRSSPARSLVVEVDWVSGRKPSSAALAHLEGILKRELAKPDGVDVRPGGEIATTRASWTVQDLLAAEEQFRSEHSGGSRATMWMAYVAGSFAGTPSALGVAFTASAAVIFRDRIDDATSALILASEIERSVVTHEAGHLLGLVNLGYESRFDHEDPAHPNHSNNRDSVMYWAVEDVSLRNLLTGGPPDDFDAADRADLATLRGS